LRSLVDAQLLQLADTESGITYRFKHALIRDAAYEALLRTRRKELHRLIGHAINEKFPQIKNAHPEVLARHWTEAGEVETAIAEWSRAGKAAEARSAFQEALQSYEQALAQVTLLPKSAERDLRELEQRQSIVQTLWITRGYSAPQTIEATEQAAALAERSGNLDQVVNWMLARSLTAYISGELNAAGALLDRTLELAIRQNSSISVGSIYALQVETRYFRGDLLGAEKHFAAGLQFFRDIEFGPFTVGAAVAAFGAASLNAWMLGCIALASERMGEMVAVTNANNPYDLALSGVFAAQFHLFLREYVQAESCALRAIEVSRKHQFPYFAALSRCTLGYARAQLGHEAEGMGLIREGIEGLIKIGSRLVIGNFKAWLGAVQGQYGAVSGALETLEQALQINPDELIYRPETLRIRGELLVKDGDLEAANADFRESIALAKSMGAKSWELRSSMSLARLLASHGKSTEARELLAEIYDWFTDGFDTADLKEAKALLDELTG